MKLSNYLFFLTSIIMINAQDDNPTGHEAVGGNGGLLGTLTTSTFTSTSTSIFDDSLSTSTSALDNKVSRGNENIINIGLLCAVLML
jgi:hypothetical protein